VFDFEALGIGQMAPPTRSRRRLGLALVAAAAVTTLAVATVAVPPLRHQFALSFTRQSDDFAELYFENPEGLPSTFTPGKPIEITFGITSVSDSVRHYQYAELAQTPSGELSVGHGELVLKGGRSGHVSLRLMLPASTTGLSVRLAKQGDEIHIHLKAVPSRVR
jgi:hypothetical protein